jgi:uncharacterized protein YidB (DUF937 family)
MDLKAFWTSLPRAARVYLTAVAGVSIAALAVVVTGAATGTPLLAASPSPSPSPGTGTNYCNRFTGHVAANLGKSQSQVQKAISDAVNQTIDDAVKNGDLTQSQANAIKARVGANANGGQACVGGGLKGIPGIGREGGFGRFPRAGVNTMDEIAKALGISTAQLQQDLQSGKTVQQLASAQGMDEAAFRSKLAGATKTDLDQQGKSGNLTQNQENAILGRLQNGPLPFWNGEAPRRFGPKPTPTPSPSATP